MSTDAFSQGQASLAGQCLDNWLTGVESKNAFEFSTQKTSYLVTFLTGRHLSGLEMSSVVISCLAHMRPWVSFLVQATHKGPGRTAMIPEAGGSEFKVSLGFIKTLLLKRSLRVLMAHSILGTHVVGGEPILLSCSLTSPHTNSPKHTHNKCGKDTCSSP